MLLQDDSSILYSMRQFGTCSQLLCSEDLEFKALHHVGPVVSVSLHYYCCWLVGHHTIEQLSRLEQYLCLLLLPYSFLGHISEVDTGTRPASVYP